MSIVLDLQLRALSKSATMAPEIIRSVNISHDKKPIEAWIINMNELHSKKGISQVKYRGRMPDIESLMQVWPGELEIIFNQVMIAMNSAI